MTPKRRLPIVKLTSHRRINLASVDGLEHLFCAAVVDTVDRHTRTLPLCELYDLAVCELAYAWTQLNLAESTLSLRFDLLPAFDDWWRHTMRSNTKAA